VSSQNSNYRVLHDNGSIQCLIGQGTMADSIKSALGTTEHVSFEFVQSQTLDWINQRQFLIGTSVVKFKQQVVNYLDRFGAHYFSLVGINNIISPGTQIGKGTFINIFNDLSADSIIGDHCVVTTHCQFGHNVEIGSLSHISSYAYLNNTVLGKGTIIGLRVSMVSRSQILITDYCNFILNGVVTDSVIQSGTYFGNRKMSDQNSIEHRIL